MGAPTLDTPGVSVYRIPTDAPESDGALAWDSTTLVPVEVNAGGKQGIGYSYADSATAVLIRDTLAAIVSGRNALDIGGAWQAMVHAIRNLGRPGITSMAIAAVDNALWDLKAKLLDLPLCGLLGMVRESVPVYGSGGFTSYDDARLSAQLGGWAEDGLKMVKMKVGRDPASDIDRVALARDVIGDGVQLFVDANGAYSRKQALQFAADFGDCGVTWLEEPVSSDDLEGLRLLRDRAPAGMDITAGEYGYDAGYFRRMLEAGAVDVLQADATRCAGITGFLQAAALSDAFQIPFSAHCAPSIHAHPTCAVARLRPIEYFCDHVRIEHLLFDSALTPVEGALRPDLSRPRVGLDFKWKDALPYAI
jgi:L-alanine-DL-glutamate epimerase-like enolase superfamily enzyme